MDQQTYSLSTPKRVFLSFMLANRHEHSLLHLTQKSFKHMSKQSSSLLVACKQGLSGGYLSSSKNSLSNYFDEIIIISCDYSNPFFVVVTVNTLVCVSVENSSCHIENWSNRNEKVRHIVLLYKP